MQRKRLDGENISEFQNIGFQSFEAYSEYIFIKNKKRGRVSDCLCGLHIETNKFK